ncbi:uncharacterized protein [Phaseolus vulgaris]|uniref:uncharacterized protein n=1 Tax=Phaseolus vulgaris TaxID=3885 RepID=UPI0035CA7882
MAKMLTIGFINAKIIFSLTRFQRNSRYNWHLEGKALQWHTTLMNSELDMDAPSWPGFTKSLKDQFGAIGDDPMVALMCLRQKTSVDAYHEEFDSIITRLKLANDHILSCFLGGLKQDIQMMVRMFQPTSLQHAFTLARTYEAASSQQVNDQIPQGSLRSSPSASIIVSSYQCGPQT